MKKMMLVIMILAMVCAVSMAKSESQMAVVRHGEVFKVIYKSPDLSNVKVSIVDNNGTEVYAEKLISIQEFARPYNFSELPKGDYTIFVEDGSGKKSEKIHFIDQPWIAHISRLKDEGVKVMVAVPNKGVTDFTLQVLDPNDQLIYTENQKIDADYAKVFNLKNLGYGATINLVNHATGQTKSLVVN